MLGVRILDPEGMESPKAEMEGLGLLPVATVFGGVKETHRVKGEVRESPGILQGAGGFPLEGYEIHMGCSFYSEQRPDLMGGQTSQSTQSDIQRKSGVTHPFHIQEMSGRTRNQPEGLIDPSGRVLGRYIHGLFHNAGLRKAILRRLAQWKGVTLPEGDTRQSPNRLRTREEEYDKLARLVRSSLNMELIYRLASL